MGFLSFLGLESSEKPAPLSPEVKQIIQNIKICCKGCGHYTKAYVEEPQFGGKPKQVWTYEGSFDYWQALGGEPNHRFAYFGVQGITACLGPYYNVADCDFYVDGDGNVLKFEKGEWVDKLQQLADRERKHIQHVFHADPDKL